MTITNFERCIIRMTVLHQSCRYQKVAKLPSQTNIFHPVVFLCKIKIIFGANKSVFSGFYVANSKICVCEDMEQKLKNL